MKTRILTALVGIPIVLLCIFGPSLLMYVFALVLMGMVNYELTMMPNSENQRRALLLSVINMLAVFGVYLLTDNLPFAFVVANALVMAETVFLYPSISVNEMSYMAFLTIYASWLPLHMLSLRLLENGSWLLVSVFILVWVCDSGAYFTGRLIGKHKMSPKLSPKKTIEGALGGIILTIAAAYIINIFIPIANGHAQVFVLAIFAAIGGIVGDLFESYLKRSFGVKDSGNTLPGHGGFADRFDSFIMVLPLCYYYFLFIVG